MKKKPPVSRFSKPKAVSQPGDRRWHNGGDIEIGLYARSLQKAAKTLIATLDLEPNPKTAWNASPVILLYRQAVELHLKALVDDGCNFLPSPTDHITLYTTHSLRWLAQIVRQIIKTAGWENEFKCEGVAHLADFSALVNELEELDPVKVAVQSKHRGRPGDVPSSLQKSKVLHWCPSSTPYWICWRRPQMDWRRRGTCRETGFHQTQTWTTAAISNLRFSDGSPEWNSEVAATWDLWHTDPRAQRQRNKSNCLSGRHGG
jgi:hypothetical protein